MVILSFYSCMVSSPEVSYLYMFHGDRVSSELCIRQTRVTGVLCQNTEGHVFECRLSALSASPKDCSMKIRFFLFHVLVRTALLISASQNLMPNGLEKFSFGHSLYLPLLFHWEIMGFSIEVSTYFGERCSVSFVWDWKDGVVFLILGLAI